MLSLRKSRGEDMNATGQMVITKGVQDFSHLMEESDVERLRDAGVFDVHEVVGIMEFPLFDEGLPEDRMYLFSVDGPKTSTVSRMMTRLENWAPDMTLIKRIADFPESSLAASLVLSPLGRNASRPGWGAFRISGYLTQGETPALFSGIFYELSLDVSGDATTFFPTSSPRHYDVTDLAAASASELQRAAIWGYEEDAFSISELKSA